MCVRFEPDEDAVYLHTVALLWRQQLHQLAGIAVFPRGGGSCQLLRQLRRLRRHRPEGRRAGLPQGAQAGGLTTSGSCDRTGVLWFDF